MKNNKDEIHNKWKKKKLGKELNAPSTKMNPRVMNKRQFIVVSRKTNQVRMRDVDSNLTNTTAAWISCLWITKRRRRILETKSAIYTIKNSKKG